jgi:hypothetical protein
MINEILNSAALSKQRIADLKSQSPYYPKVNIIEHPASYPLNKVLPLSKVLFASTLVRINRDNKWYIVHCVESVIVTKTVNEKNLLLNLMESVHRIQNLYMITGYHEDIDSLQKSEAERLTNIYND